MVAKSKDGNLHSKSLAYLNLDSQYVNPVLSRYTPIIAKRARGSYIYDMDGEAYLDFASGIAVTNIGHCHPKVVEAIQKQAAELIHTSVVTHNERYIELAEKLAKISPGRLNSVFLSNSGAEAIEGAVKLARYVTGKPGLINFSGSFHGRTMLTVALTTSKLLLRERYEPLPGPIFTSTYPYVYRSNHRDDPKACLSESLAYLDNVLHQYIHPDQVAAMVVEPIQGEGGYVIPPYGFLKHLRAVADKHNIMLIVDEVQTGFGRTGKMFACEHEDSGPDIMVVAKGIASGMPLSAFIARHEVTRKWPLARHGSTFGGNPVSCAAALATIEVIESENLCKRSEELGNKILERLRLFAKDKAHIAEVRGKGLMIGVEFSDEHGEPSKQITEQVARNCLERKMLVITCGLHGQVIRLIPPLTLSDSEAEKACEILEASMTI